MSAPLPRAYRGYMLYPCEPGSRARLNGWRWECFLGLGRGSVYADTLAGIKTLVRDHGDTFTH